MPAGGKLLLTPGPLTTRIETRRAMLDDWGSREAPFIALTQELRRRLLDVVSAGDDFVAVPLQGSGTFIVEAALSTLLDADAKLLALINGAYGDRMLRIARRLGRSVETLTWPEREAIDPAAVAEALRARPESPTSPWSTARPRRACSIPWRRSPRWSPSMGRR